MFLLRWGSLLSHCMGESALFLSRMNWNTYTLFLKAEGALSMFTRSELSSVF